MTVQNYRTCSAREPKFSKIGLLEDTLKIHKVDPNQFRIEAQLQFVIEEKKHSNTERRESKGTRFYGRAEIKYSDGELQRMYAKIILPAQNHDWETNHHYELTY